MDKALTLSTISNGALGSSELPTSLKLLEYGETQSVKGPIILNDESLASFDDFQRENGRERVAIDFNHNTVPGTMAYDSEQEPRRIAGYGRPVLTKDGLSLADITWTPTGMKAAKDYEDLSPAVILTKENVVVGMDSVALTPTGAIGGLHFYSVELKHMKKTKSEVKVEVAPLSAEVKSEAKTEVKVETKVEVKPDVKVEAKPEVKVEVTPLAADEAPKDEKKDKASEDKKDEAKADDKKEEKTLSVSDKLQSAKSKLELPDDASDEAIVDALLELLSDDDGDGDETIMTSSVDAKKVQDFSATITSLTNRLTDNEKEFIVYKATQEGKLIPLSADSIKTTTVEVLKEMVQNLPKGQVPMKVTTRVLSAAGKPLKGLKLSAAAIEAELNHKQ